MLTGVVPEHDGVGKGLGLALEDDVPAVIRRDDVLLRANPRRN